MSKETYYLNQNCNICERWDCCCEYTNEQKESYKATLKVKWDKFIEEQKDLDSDIIEMVNKNFWDLI